MIDTLKWIHSVVMWILRLSTARITLLVILTLLSKVSSTLALFLPIKIIMLVRKDSMPNYFPDLLLSFEKNTLLILLCAISIGLYLFHASIEKWMQHLEQGATLALKDKIPLFRLSGSTKILRKIFSRVSKSLAELFFFSIIIFFITYFYPGLLLVISAYALLLIASFEISKLFNTNISQKTYSEDSFDDNSQSSFWFDIGFLITFVYIIYDLIRSDNPNVFTAFIGFLLIRQSSNGLKRISRDIRYINAQRIHLEKFVTKTLSKKSIQGTQLKGFPEKQELKKICTKIIQPELIEPIKNVKIKWYNIDSKNALAYQVTVYSSSSRKSFLIKLYKTNQEHQAYREISILKSFPQLPALPLVNNGEFMGYHWLLLDWNPLIESSQEEQAQFNKNLSNLKLPASLVQEWTHNHSLIWQRLDIHYWMSLKGMAHLVNSDTKKTIDLLTQQSTEICGILRNLPLVIVNETPTKKHIKALVVNESLISVNWASWSIEPLGAGLLVVQEDLEKIGVDTCPLTSPLITKRINIHHIKLSALLYRMEKLILQKKPTEGLQLSQCILEQYNKCNRVSNK